jgi:hypothetical protein
MARRENWETLAGSRTYDISPATIARLRTARRAARATRQGRGLPGERDAVDLIT